VNQYFPVRVGQSSLHPLAYLTHTAPPPTHNNRGVSNFTLDLAPTDFCASRLASKHTPHAGTQAHLRALQQASATRLT